MTSEGKDMIVRKLRLEKGWSQETLAEVSELSVRTIQRIERGGQASLETLNALAAVLDVDVKTLSGETDMTSNAARPAPVPADEAEALEYVRDIKGFYAHFASYCGVMILLAIIWLVGDNPHPWFLWPAFGWGIGVLSHWAAVSENFGIFSPDWERRQVQKRLERKRRG